MFSSRSRHTHYQQTNRSYYGIILLLAELSRSSHLPPITLIIIILNVLIYFDIFPLFGLSNNLQSVCVSTHAVLDQGDYMRILLAPFFHGDDMHLYYNMASFLYKGQQLETLFGGRYFALLVTILTISSSLMLVILGQLASSLFDNPEYLFTCAIGFSAVIFALKVITTHYTPDYSSNSLFGFIPVSTKYIVWVELIVIQLITPNVSFLGDDDDDDDDDYLSFERVSIRCKDDIPPDYSQLDSYPSNGIINQKSSHDDQTENGSYNISSTVAIRSNVSNLQKKKIDIPILQAGRGTVHWFKSIEFNFLLFFFLAGEQTVVYTNHFSIKFGKPANEVIIYQYDINVKILMSDGSWRTCIKDERLEALQKLIKEEHFPLVWYDDEKNLYAAKSLISTFTKDYEFEIDHNAIDKNNKFRCSISLVKTYELKNIFNVIQERKSTQLDDQVKIFDVLFKHIQRSNMITIENELYPKCQLLNDLGDGRGIGSGFYQAIVFGERGPTLNINNIYRCFYQSYNLIKFISCYLNYDIQLYGILPEDHTLLIENILKFLWFVIKSSNKICQYRLKSFGCSASEHKYAIDGTKQITAVDYFHDKLQIHLRHPHLPVVEIYNPNDENQSYILPMELVNVDEGQTILQSLTAEQYAKIKKKTVVSPGERYKMIRRIVNERRFNQDLYLKQFGITVNTDEMVMLPARILSRAEIKYKSLNDGSYGDVIESIQIGKWCLNNRFNKTYEIRTWAVVFVSSHKPDSQQIDLTRKFAQRISEAMSKYDIRFNSSPIEKSIAAVPKTIILHMKELRKQKCKVIFYILYKTGDCIYHLMKALEYWKNNGLVIRTIDFKHLESKSTSTIDKYFANLVDILNTTADGINQLVSSIWSLTSPSAQHDIFMFFGIACTHITYSYEQPPITTIIGSKDSTGRIYTNPIQFSPQEKVSLKFINELHIYVRQLLCEFSNYNSCLPNKLVLYRAGVDDGSSEKILNNELPAIRQACQEIYGHNSLPKICFIVVKNNHNTYFFTFNKQSNQANSVQPGTVIDTDIVLQNGFHFYLNSNTTKSTSQPTFYEVLYNDIGFTSNDIQQLTYYLCHTDVEDTDITPVPAPIHYATRGVICDDVHTNESVNRRFDRIVKDPIFTTYLNLTVPPYGSLDFTDPILDRFCSKILPYIQNKIEWIDVEPLSMERILHSRIYPRLYGLGLIKFSSNKARNLFTDGNFFIQNFKYQISSLVVRINKCEEPKTIKNTNIFIYTQILTNFINLKSLNFNPTPAIEYYRLAFGASPPNISSSILLHLRVVVESYEDCLYLLDGRFHCLQTFYVTIICSSNSLASPLINNRRIIEHLQSFALILKSVLLSYNNFLIPLLHRMINLEELNLCFISHNTSIIDGNDLEMNIMNYMTKLKIFKFNIHSIIPFNNQINLPSNEYIQHTFKNFINKNQIISSIDSFPKANQFHCHIYSCPYIWLDYNNITNNFRDGSFESVRKLSLVDERPFEHEFFLRIAKSFPSVRRLHVHNREPQKNKNQQWSIIEYPYLIELNLLQTHDNYVEQFLNNNKLSLVKNISLHVDYNTLQKLTDNFTSDTTRLNCSKMKYLTLYNQPQICSPNFKDYFAHAELW
ncbi:unnamed protein product [Rotaria sordida]|uniref:Uncharacterized protein n=1 Tax=Rotaria sordida TaxID=392033 RepID=A0A818Y435_9BILA|nr:unnamed protein product [Rotaria sordida]CAF3749389.1 unnamed protein product [Rotaria sordida]